MMRHADDMRARSLLTRAREDHADPAAGRYAAAGEEALAVALDTLVAGVHFRDDSKSEDVAHKALAVNLSDLAAMGAKPEAVTVSLTAPRLSGDWIEGFRRGLAAAAATFGVEVIAADLDRGPLMVTVEALGRVPGGAALRRDGARPGDRVFVTGTLGDAGLGLETAQGRRPLSQPQAAYVLARLDRPVPRIGTGAALRGVASAAIDLSDGLAGDLGHILERSGVGACVDVDRLPLSPVLKGGVEEHEALGLAVGFGDDYELCFTVSEAGLARLDERRGRLECAITRIGIIEARPGLRFRRGDGRPFEAPEAWDHFRTRRRT